MTIPKGENRAGRVARSELRFAAIDGGRITQVSGRTASIPDDFTGVVVSEPSGAHFFYFAGKYIPGEQEDQR
jgi:hypothetical protein